MKSTWNVIKFYTKPIRKSKDKTGIFDLCEYTSEEELVKNLNKHFINICERKDTQVPQDIILDKKSRVQHSIFMKPTDSTEVYITHSSKTNTVGYDEIPIKFIKCMGHIIPQPLSHIINKFSIRCLPR
ncbi:hypothetical protein HHI36_011338 [Cryptolaemus montrouzieri]|uniref:Uncharacterized protein n=1 Tax=Cryptolaemus montrouzieri TaxID=559131 RepID=A0ABD2MLD9_9CUCU